MPDNGPAVHPLKKKNVKILMPSLGNPFQIYTALLVSKHTI